MIVAFFKRHVAAKHVALFSLECFSVAVVLSCSAYPISSSLGQVCFAAETRYLPHTWPPPLLRGIFPNNGPQGGDSTNDQLYDAASVDDGNAVVLVGKGSTYLVAVKLDSSGNELWKWEVGFARAFCSQPHAVFSPVWCSVACTLVRAHGWP